MKMKDRMVRCAYCQGFGFTWKKKWSPGLVIYSEKCHICKGRKFIMIDTIPEVTWGSVTCSTCCGKGQYWYLGEMIECPSCRGEGEIVDVIEVRDGKEIVEDE